jgi:energy-coupling factor transport system permease protein
VSGRAAGYYRAGSSWPHRRHPLTKALAVLLVLAIAFLWPPVSLTALAGGLLLAAASAGLGGPLLRSLRVPLVLVASIVIVNALFFPGGRDVVAALGPLTITREGLTFGLVSAGRFLVAFMALVLFLFTTLADDLLEALAARGVSHRIGFVVLSAMQLVPRMQARANGILAAQQARGMAVGGGLTRRARTLVPLVAPVLLGALVDVRERTFALEARGFGARPGRTAYRTVEDPPGDRVIRFALMAALATVLVGALFGWPG